MTTRWSIFLIAFLLGVITATIAAPSTDSKKENAKSETATKETKDKRSQEEIMFGNQQNKPANLVDDILSYEEKKDEEPIFTPTVKNTTENDKDENKEEQQIEKLPPKDISPQKPEVPGRRYDYLDYVDDNSEQRHDDNEYGIMTPSASQPNEGQGDVIEPQLYSMQDVGNYPYDFSNALYRRKRNLRSRTLPIRKRSFRTSLKDLLSRRKRLSRRALRLKRQTNVENLLELLGRPLPEWQTSGRFDDLEDDIPSGFGVLPGGIRMPLDSEATVKVPEFIAVDDRYNTYALPETIEDYEPNGLLIDDDEELPAFRDDDDQSWVYRRKPLYTVTRRSPSYFYPVDYRFVPMPGQKKRSRDQSDQGKWGKVVQVPPSYNPSDDMARLYALANLLAETEEPEYHRYRRSP